MKKLLTLVALLGAASMTFGQGTINFFNTTKTTVRTNSVMSGPTTGTMNTDPNAYYFALFSAPSTVTTVAGGNPNDPNWTFSTLYATNTATAGVFSGASTFPTAPQYAAGSTLSIFAVGWSANIGTTWAQANAWYTAGQSSSVPFTGWFGLSGVATTVVLGGGAVPSGTPFGIGAGQAGSFSLLRTDAPVPEPSTFALAGLGAAALLIFRRRKQ